MIAALRHGARLARAARALAAHGALDRLLTLADAPAMAHGVVRLAAFGARGRREGGGGLAAALADLGPSYIKLGQMLATRADLIGPELRADSARLQDRARPFRMDAARASVAAELGATVESLFDDFGPAVAAASIAQVHIAHVRDPEDGTRRRVAVKVLRPGVEKAFARDLDSFFWAARIIERLIPRARRLRPRQIVETLADSVRLEMDLRLEAAAASEFAEAIGDRLPVRAPTIDWTRTTARVMTQEWVFGVPVHDQAALDAQGVDRPALAATVIRAFLEPALERGLFHADMHQGNLFIDDAARLVVVDFGIMGRIDIDTRRYLALILRGFLERDYAGVADVHFEAGYVSRTKDRGAFAQALRSVGEPIFGRVASQISMGRVLAQLFRVTQAFDMETQPQLLMLQKTMVVVEGVARDIDPDVDMWECSRPIVERWMLGHLGPLAGAREAADGAMALVRAFPSLASDAMRAHDAISNGVRLHPESIAALAKAQGAQDRRFTAAEIAAATLALVAAFALGAWLF